MSDKELQKRIDELELRQQALEKMVRGASLRAGADPLTSDEVAEALKQLGQKTVGLHPNGNYFNERFRDYEIAMLNIKNLGYRLGEELYQRNKPLHVGGPRVVPMSSRLCTQTDMDSEWFAFWCAEIKSAAAYHRKLWELCFIAQSLYSEGKLKPGSYGLGFGCGNEPLPALFAKYGARVLATDIDPTRPEAQAWQDTHQHATAIASLRRRDICPDEERLLAIDLRSVDMNMIPRDLDRKFDFCWSACALEHLGSLANGLEFIEKSLNTLKPGGIAVHTTEFTLHEGETVDNWATVLYRRDHFTALADRLRSRGHHVFDIDFNPGRGVMDGFIDIPPWASALAGGNPSAHLKLSVDGFVCTSFGIIVRASG